MGKKRKQKANILVVDDDPLNIEIIEEILAGEFQLASAESGIEALETAATFHPDIVLLDIMMPDMDGYEVCKRLRNDESLSLTKIILVSAKQMLSDRIEGYRAGADDYITKPFDPEELVAKVKVFVRLKSVEEVERIKSDLISVFSHETRTPLNSILGFAKILLENPALSKTEKEALTHIRKNGEEMLKLVDKTILLSNLRDGKSEMKLHKILLKRVIGMAVERVDSELKYSEVDVVVGNVPETILEVDENLMVTALSCLLNKAIKLAAKKSAIRVEMEDGAQPKNLTVTAFGNPIQDTEIPKEFSVFHVNDVAHHGRGGGLDLSIVGHVIESHGGRISVWTNEDSTKFTLTFPDDIVVFPAP
jgi:DNA-binding response OmpR family regulator